MLDEECSTVSSDPDIATEMVGDISILDEPTKSKGSKLPTASNGSSGIICFTDDTNGVFLRAKGANEDPKFKHVASFTNTPNLEFGSILVFQYLSSGKNI